VVAEASDGLEAMRLCEKHHPDPLVSDIGMPKTKRHRSSAGAQMDRPRGVSILSVHGDESSSMRAPLRLAPACVCRKAQQTRIRVGDHVKVDRAEGSVADFSS
jgi:DNA-binding NarL/FixJ family response regulator